MYDPNDDTDVTSGTTDGAQMETTSPPDARYMEAGGNETGISFSPSRTPLMCGNGGRCLSA